MLEEPLTYPQNPSISWNTVWMALL